MKKYAVIVAGGAGLRMGSLLPKQFLLIHNWPIVWYTMQVFLKSYKDIQIILVLPEEYYDTGRAICDEMNPHYPVLTVTGGKTRFHSVQKGLSFVQESSVVFVHDAVRCLLSPSLIHLCYEDTIRFGSAIPCIESKDSIRILIEDDHVSVNRKSIRLVQTPQTFMSDQILPAYQVPYRESFTDDASVLEAAGRTVHLVEGEANNIKITTPLDLAIAEKLLDPPHHPI
ncbi:MAG TPA: 2-C-methyl-D-erythritol 4-phosphate cytidylyltransferase [Puia sp.]